MCSEGSLQLTPPEVHNATSQGWQISQSYDFTNAIDYTDQVLDESYNNWLIRFWASDGTQISYSNTSIIRAGHPEESEEEETACDMFLWHGNIYTESGDYTIVVPSTYYDCDHTITLHLTILQSVNMSEIQGESEVLLDPENPTITLPYEVEISDPDAQIQWVLSNPDWQLSIGNDPRHCEVTINSLGYGTLSVMAENTCGVDARYLQISSTIDGIGEMKAAFAVYPNPTDGVLFVETRHGTSLPDQTYRITNLMGQIILSGNITNETQQIDVSNLHEGMYFITMGETTRKFVIR